MIKFFQIFCFLLVTSLFVSCTKTEDPVVEYVVPLAEQYPTDLAKIEKYLDEFNMAVDVNFDVTLKKIPIPNPSNLQSIRAQYTLQNKIVSQNGIDYKVYYISFREGVKDRPTRVDSVFVSYKGQLLDENLSVFDQNSLTVFTLNQTISGWQNIFPLFKSGTAVPNLSNGTIDYNDFGAGIMFVPSGLAYYNQARVGIPAYSPLIFSFKLKQVNFVDNEFDRIDSVFEDLNGDSNPFNDDSDGDGIPNFVDIDDDADYIPTKTEIKRPAINISTGEVLVDAISKEIIYAGYYPYNGAAVDDTSTTNIDERQGIPRKFTGPLKNPTSPESADNLRTPLPSDFTDVNRLRRHLDPTSKPPYYNKS